MKINGVINNKTQFPKLPKFNVATKVTQDDDIKLLGLDALLNQNKTNFFEIKFKGLKDFIRTNRLNKEETEKREKRG